MYCPKCGTPNIEESKFCMKCGTQLPNQSANNLTTSKPEKPIPQEEQKKPLTTKSEPKNSITPKKSFWEWLKDHPVVILVGLASSIIAIVIYVTGINSLPELFSPQRALENKLVGRWVSQGGENIFVFYDNGTINIEGTNVPVTGKYKAVDGNHISLQFNGLVGVLSLGSNVVYQIQFSGNKLIMTDPNGSSETFYEESGFSANQQNEGEGQTPTYTYKLYGWRLRKQESSKKPGWTDYDLTIGIASNISNSPLLLSNLDYRASVTTEDGHSYDAFLMETFVTDMVNQTNGISLYDPYNQVVLPPGVIIRGKGDDGITRTRWFFATFSIPSTLKPKQLVAKDAVPLDLTNLPDQDPQINMPLANAGNGNNFPFDFSMGGTYQVKMNNARIVRDEKGVPSLAIDTDLISSDMTSDQVVNLSFFAIDSSGVLYKDTWYFCGDQQRDFKIDSGKAIVGPGQTLKGITCLRLRGIQNDSLNQGIYIVSGVINGQPVWFKTSLAPN